MTNPLMRRVSPTAGLMVVWTVLLVLWLVLGLRGDKLNATTTTGAAVGPRAATPVRIRFESDLDSLAGAFDELDSLLRRGSPDAVRASFRRSRRNYKRAEALLAYYSPATAAVLNGPVSENGVDDAPQALGRSAAFSRIEHAIFVEAPTSADRRSAAATADTMRIMLHQFRSATALLDVSDTATLDAARYELARVTTLGLSGFDSNESGDAILASADAVDGIRQSLTRVALAGRNAGARAAVDAAVRALDSAESNLRAAPRYDDFNRLRFIARYAAPAARSIQTLRRMADATPPALRRAWVPTAATPFDSAAFDPWAFAPDNAAARDTALVTAGRRLFSDARLSGTGTRSCATCHVPSRGFSDGRAHAAAIGTHDPTTLRGTPTLWNVALQPELFADQRAASLEDQIRVVLSSPAEMAAPQHVVDDRSVRLALAAYLRSLTALNSRVDLAMRGDTLALNESERRGFNLFTGRARCATCHFAPLFNGTMPPDFTRSELEIIGVPARPATSHAIVDSDAGRARVDGLGVHANAFKVPSLRNVALTAPYMHNGVFATLEQVVDFYNRGGGVGIGERLPEQTLSSHRLGLSAGEQRSIVAFLRALTDTSALLVARP